jgi:hypothetical protein
MKKFLFVISILFFFSLNSSAQINVCAYFDGFWSPWGAAVEAKIYGNYEGFVIHSAEEGPWGYRFKFKIDNFNVPKKKQRKKDMKANKFYEFTGTVEYYVSDIYPTAIDAFRDHKGPWFSPAKNLRGNPAKKITSKATIKVAAFKDYPKVYNIWYDNVGLGINLNNIGFSHKVEYK